VYDAPGKDTVISLHVRAADHNTLNALIGAIDYARVELRACDGDTRPGYADRNQIRPAVAQANIDVL
jgi:hypothetical protein